MNADQPTLAAINRRYLGDEEHLVRTLADLARVGPAERERIAAQAQQFVAGVRAAQAKRTGLDAFLRKYDLSSQEGVILMCLAEALLRIPDDATADKLIADKIAAGDWASHFDDAESLFVNASTWGLMLTGRIVRPSDVDMHDPRSFVAKLAGRLGEPVLRAAFRQAMRIMGHQFVMGRTIEEALERSRDAESRKYRHSFDMLGEAALTRADADRYFAAYKAAIGAIARTVNGAAIEDAPSISVKLSALFPRYEYTQRARVLNELAPKLHALALAARAGGVPMTVDAEEAERLELSLELIEHVARSPELSGWNGFGLAVQAYQKRALDVIEWLRGLADATQRRLNVRLVKGAYWDSEIKRAQERGLSGYPVYTRKANTDVSYISCARALIAAGPNIYPQFATHNAQTVATILELSRAADRKFEFQRLHGMGEELYEQIVGQNGLGKPCRVYAPVGSHEDLLPYLVRRLLENGANTSFVNRIVDEQTAIAEIVRDPVAEVDALKQKAHSRIPPPRLLYGSSRLNSRGVNLPDPVERDALLAGVQRAMQKSWEGGPIVEGKLRPGAATRQVRNPANLSQVIGSTSDADEKAIEAAFAAAVPAQLEWDATPAGERAETLERAADLFEERTPELIAYCAREGGRTIVDSIAEVREAVDFLRYYADRARTDFGHGMRLPGPTGESNELRLRGRGVFVCISPWNFPLAIFTGQIAAALAAGNSVIAKPAEQTPLIASRAVQILLEAGVPAGALHLLPGDGAAVGARIVSDARVAGVAFTGSTETAKAINRSLANRAGAIPVLIAETGGQNAMIVDSSALPEQIVMDVVQSGFNSAGQRCSALRALFVQEEIAERVMELLAGYMEELQIGDPMLLATDVGPVIDEDARKMLEKHAAAIVKGARWSHACKLAPEHANGMFFAPMVVEIDSLSQLTGEVFGPIVHVVRYSAHKLDDVIAAVNATGYGLTLGIHTRVDATARYIASRVRAGNVYVNRNMIGAVVGVQPFGGRGLSGTGPKAGGPHYLPRFGTEQTVTINTAAVGGNASLLAMTE